MGKEKNEAKIPEWELYTPKGIRWIWYSANCSYWTDNFDNLSATAHGSIPCCPHCGCVGYQAESDKWDEGITTFNTDDPGYQNFIMGLKKVCRGNGVSVSALWKDYKKHKLGKNKSLI